MLSEAWGWRRLSRRYSRAEAILRSPESGASLQMFPSRAASVTLGRTMAFWACVQTAPQREWVARHFLELSEFKVYFPAFSNIT